MNDSGRTSEPGAMNAPATAGEILREAIARGDSARMTALSWLLAFTVVTIGAGTWLALKATGERTTADNARQAADAAADNARVVSQRVEAIDQKVEAVGAAAAQTANAVAAGMSPPDRRALDEVARSLPGIALANRTLAVQSQVLNGVRNGLTALGSEVAAVAAETRQQTGQISELRGSVTQAGNRIEAVTAQASALLARLNALDARLARVEEEVGRIGRFKFSSYAVKQNATTPIADLALRVRMGTIRNGRIAVDVLSGDGGEVLASGTRSVAPGAEEDPMTFRYRGDEFTLMFTYVFQRALARDYVGLTIGRRPERP